MRILIAVVLVAAFLWFGYWFVGSRALQAGIEQWFAARRAEGWVAETSDITVRGFPNRFDATLSGIELADPDTGLAWTAPFFQMLALSYRPNHLIAVWPHEQTLMTPWQRIEATTTEMRASVVLDDGADLALNRVALVAEDLQLDSSAAWSVAAQGVRFATRRRPGSLSAHEVGFDATGLSPGAGLRDRLDPARALPPEIGRLHLDATIDFDAPWNRHALAAARPQPTQVTLGDLSAEWGGLKLSAAGDLDVDTRGVPAGRIVVSATNWREMLELAVTAGALPASLATTVERTLEALATLAGGGDTLDVPLIFAGGRVSVGPMPLGPAPRLVLR